MTRSGVYLFALGSLLISAPLHACYKKFGDISDENFVRWLLERTIEEWVRIRLMGFLGLMFMSFGLFR